MDLKDTFKKDYDDKITIEWDDGAKKISKKGESAVIDRLPKTIKVSKINNCIWPETIVASESKPDRVEINSADWRCSVTRSETLWKIKLSSTDNEFSLEIRSKGTLGVHHPGHFPSINGVTVTIGEP